MTPRHRRIAELIAARDHIDKQIHLLTGGDTPQPRKEPTPAQIRAHAEQIRARAIRQFRDTPVTQAARLHDLNVDADAKNLERRNAA